MSPVLLRLQESWTRQHYGLPRYLVMQIIESMMEVPHFRKPRYIYIQEYIYNYNYNFLVYSIFHLVSWTWPASIVFVCLFVSTDIWKAKTFFFGLPWQAPHSLGKGQCLRYSYNAICITGIQPYWNSEISVFFLSSFYMIFHDFVLTMLNFQSFFLVFISFKPNNIELSLLSRKPPLLTEQFRFILLLDTRACCPWLWRSWSLRYTQPLRDDLFF
jgi:hypothetical protein